MTPKLIIKFRLMCWNSRYIFVQSQVRPVYLCGKGDTCLLQYTLCLGSINIRSRSLTNLTLQNIYRINCRRSGRLQKGEASLLQSRSEYNRTIPLPCLQHVCSVGCYELMSNFLATFLFCLFGLWLNFHCSGNNIVHGRVQLRFEYVYLYALKEERSQEKWMLRALKFLGVEQQVV